MVRFCPPTIKTPAMRKSKAIGLLKVQIEKINDPNIKRPEWINNTSAVLTRIFPLSSAAKILQIEGLENIPEFYEDISSEKRIQTDKKKAEAYLKNYIEEIELLGMETNNKMEMFFGSFRFWSILLTICLLSFLGGNSIAVGKELQAQKNSRQEVYSLSQELLLQKAEIDSLNKLLKELRENI